MRIGGWELSFFFLKKNRSEYIIIVNVPTIENKEEIIVEVEPTNMTVYISGILNEIPSMTDSMSVGNNIFKNGTSFEHVISLPSK